MFSTAIAHDFVLRVPIATGQTIDLPATADAARGGFAIDAHALPPGMPKSQVKGTLRGFWGFDAYEGPSFNLRAAHAGEWTISARTVAHSSRTEKTSFTSNRSAPCAWIK